MYAVVIYESLTGKYLDGTPEGSRASLPGYDWLANDLTDAAKNDAVRTELVDLARAARRRR